MGALAYSLYRSDSGWTWRIVDARGVTLAAGAEPSRSLALQALDVTLRAAAQAVAPGAQGAALGS